MTGGFECFLCCKRLEILTDCGHNAMKGHQEGSEIHIFAFQAVFDRLVVRTILITWLNFTLPFRMETFQAGFGARWSFFALFLRCDFDKS